MYPRTFRHFRLATGLSLTVCTSLLPAPISLSVQGAAQSQNQRADRTGHPRPDKPEGTLPNLDEIKSESQIVREALPPIPSTIRSRKNEGKPWDGRRVGDPGPPDGLDRAGGTSGGGSGFIAR